MPLFLIKHTRRLIKIRQKTRFSVKTELNKKIFRFFFKQQNVTSRACILGIRRVFGAYQQVFLYFYYLAESLYYVVDLTILHLHAPLF